MSVVPCTSCGRVIPTRHKKCVYCGCPVDSSATPVFSGTGKRKTGARPQSGAMHEEPRLLGDTKARFKKVSSDKSHVLVVATGEPIELAEGKLFVIGRDPRASLVVHSADVSRQHAEIEWDKANPPRPLLNEIRAQNGTFLNGVKVRPDDPRPLRSGDEILLGEGFRARYLHVTPRELRQELQERGGDDTRRLSRVRTEDGSPTTTQPAPAAAPAPPPDAEVLGDLVAAAFGEGDLSALETQGDFSRQHGKLLVKRLYSQRQTGILTVFDGTDVGEMILVEGRCRHARLGMLTNRDALEYVARLNVGKFRFRAQDPDVLVDASPPAEVDEHGLSLSGDFQQTPASDVVRDLVARRSTGVLTVFGDSSSGQVVLREGICQEAAYGRERGREALDAIVRLAAGVFRYRPSTLDALTPPTWSVPPRGEPPQPAARGGPPPVRAGAPPARGGTPRRSPLRAPDDEAGV
ncbi:MAG: FHA domain-containing protein, partial [Planctomycetes bacterium]|nr:FHA domain-containing protein [Planctomycetota bacterium]